jgi:hypothetical protein
MVIFRCLSRSDGPETEHDGGGLVLIMDRLDLLGVNERQEGH